MKEQGFSEGVRIHNKAIIGDYDKVSKGDFSVTSGLGVMDIHTEINLYLRNV